MRVDFKIASLVSEGDKFPENYIHLPARKKRLGVAK
jgi:hypothetical protein